MSAERIARALGGASRGSDGWWSCRCPAHEDRKASLGLHDANDGGVAWKCMAGCDSKAVGAALKYRGLLPEKAKRERKTKAKLGPIVATYDYVDPAGELLFQVTRHSPPKDFRQRRPDPANPGGWIWSVGDILRPLYRLPELLATDPGELVFLAEGEKDVDRLRSLGLVATTSSQGADGWAKTDHGPLAGRRVVILPDNDAAGRKYALAASGNLAGKAASSRCSICPAYPPKAMYRIGSMPAAPQPD